LCKWQKGKASHFIDSVQLKASDLQIFASRARFALTLQYFGIMNPRHLEKEKSDAEKVLRREHEKLKKMHADLATAIHAIDATLGK